MTSRPTPLRFVSLIGLMASLGACGPGYAFNEVSTAEGGGTGPVPTVDCSTNTDTYANYGQAFVAKNCGQSCHPMLAKPDLTTQASFQDATNKAGVVNRVEVVKNMPLGTQLSDDERAKFANWVNCGAK